MKTSKMINLKTVKPLVLAAFFLIFIGGKMFAQDGKALFNANCAACHKIDKDFVGPGLLGAKARWEENSSLDNLYKWVKNSGELIEEGDAYANKLIKKWKAPMPPQSLTNEEIDAIFDFVETPVETTATKGGGEKTSEIVNETPKGTSTWLWWLIGGLLLVVLFVVNGVKGDLANAALEQEGDELLERKGLLGSVRAYLWKHFNYAFFFGFVIVLILLVAGVNDLNKIGVFEDYHPEQPIAYSHKLHAGDLEIECVYCHNSVEKSKTAGIPTTNVCMNCHKAVSEGTTTGTGEIAKIYEAAGFNPDKMQYSGETKPIQWVKVHNLPDHVYFNHSQHVVVGGLDCKQCHGDMTKETTARVMTVADLNAVEDNEIKFTRPVLTMGWCIECHSLSEVDIQSSDASGYYKEIHERLKNDKTTYQKYLEDDKITVAELGGWECAKCHY
ncbi:MAG TPA: c-type cytochrome [Crocinitomix sp.]|nr:c-type cytochrome [Crocinitomix sp.]